MITLVPMGRRKLNRKKCNITLPPELAQKADDLAMAQSRPLSHLIEELLTPYVAKRWEPSMVRPAPKPKRKP